MNDTLEAYKKQLSEVIAVYNETKDAYSDLYHKYAKIPRWIRWIFKAN